MKPTYAELVASLAGANPPDGLDAPLRALWLARKGDWDGAHRVATDITNATGSRIHAHLHRVEGDLSNAGYWYRQARALPETGTLDAEWEKLAREFTSG